MKGKNMYFFKWRKKINENDIFYKNFMIKNQTGRSMLEMLGVLAIIGVLSVGSLGGYRYAINKYRANTILNDVNMRMVDIAHQVYLNQDEIGFSEDWSLTGNTGHVMDIFQNTDSEPSIMVEKVASDICKIILKSSSDTQDIFVGKKVADNHVDGNWYLGDNEDICGDDEEKEILFALSPEVLAGYNPKDSTHDGLDPEEIVTIPPQVECSSNTDCRPDKPFCNSSGKCVRCYEDSHCSGNTPVCDVANERCVECLKNTHCTNEAKPYCNPKKGVCTICYGQPYGTVCKLSGKEYEGMCYGEDTCQDWCGETPLVGSCRFMDTYCKNQGGRATVYQLMLISDNPLYCKKRRDDGNNVTATYGSTTYTYAGQCPDTERYKGLWNQLKNACSTRRDRYISNVDGVEVYRNGSLGGSECGSGNWWSCGACYNDVQAIIDAYDAANPIME